MVLVELEERGIGFDLGYRPSSFEEFWLALIHPPLVTFSGPSLVLHLVEWKTHLLVPNASLSLSLIYRFENGVVELDAFIEQILEVGVE
jgi:hypothetical protein